jgi:hypothetical protein
LRFRALMLSFLLHLHKPVLHILLKRILFITGKWDLSFSVPYAEES